jgi:hypothetical protein
MDELERFRIRMIGEEHNRRRRQEARRARWINPVVMWGTLCVMVKTWFIR